MLFPPQRSEQLFRETGKFIPISSLPQQTNTPTRLPSLTVDLTIISFSQFSLHFAQLNQKKLAKNCWWLIRHPKDHQKHQIIETAQNEIRKCVSFVKDNYHLDEDEERMKIVQIEKSRLQKIEDILVGQIKAKQCNIYMNLLIKSRSSCSFTSAPSQKLVHCHCFLIEEQSQKETFSFDLSNTCSVNNPQIEQIIVSPPKSKQNQGEQKISNLSTDWLGHSDHSNDPINLHSTKNIVNSFAHPAFNGKPLKISEMVNRTAKESNLISSDIEYACSLKDTKENEPQFYDEFESLLFQNSQASNEHHELKLNDSFERLQKKVSSHTNLRILANLEHKREKESQECEHILRLRKKIEGLKEEEKELLSRNISLRVEIKKIKNGLDIQKLKQELMELKTSQYQLMGVNLNETESKSNIGSTHSNKESQISSEEFSHRSIQIPNIVGLTSSVRSNQPMKSSSFHQPHQIPHNPITPQHNSNNHQFHSWSIPNSPTTPSTANSLYYANNNSFLQVNSNIVDHQYYTSSDKKSTHSNQSGQNNRNFMASHVGFQEASNYMKGESPGQNLSGKAKIYLNPQTNQYYEIPRIQGLHGNKISELKGNNYWNGPQPGRGVPQYQYFNHPQVNPNIPKH